MSEQEPRPIAVALIPRDQRFSFRITPLPGRLLDLATVGGSMKALAKFHALLGNDIDPSLKWKSCITGCELEGDGSFRLDIAVLPAKSNRCRHCDAGSELHEDATGFHHVVDGDAVPCEHC